MTWWWEGRAANHPARRGSSGHVARMERSGMRDRSRISLRFIRATIHRFSAPIHSAVIQVGNATNGIRPLNRSSEQERAKGWRWGFGAYLDELLFRRLADGFRDALACALGRRRVRRRQTAVRRVG